MSQRLQSSCVFLSPPLVVKMGCTLILRFGFYDLCSGSAFRVVALFLDFHYGFWEVFKPAVEAGVSLRQDEVEREKRQNKVHVMLDFSFLRKYMEDGGMVVQNLKCS